MTKKDYTLIAETIADRMHNIQRLYDIGQWDKMEYTTANILYCDLAIELAYNLKKQNPKFSFDKFIQACSVKLK